MAGLTPKQAELLMFIGTPSCEEMAVGVGLISRSGIHRMLRGLQERGLITWIPKRARSVELMSPVAVAAWPDESWPTEKLFRYWKRAQDILNSREARAA